MHSDPTSIRAWLAARAWTLSIAALAVILHVVHALTPQVSPANWPLLALSRDAMNSGWWWTLATGAMLHVSWMHVLMDALGLVIVGCVFEPRFSRTWPLLIVLINLIVGASVLALYPHLPGYCGLSALDQGLLAAGCIWLVHDRRHAAAAIIGGTLIVKWIFEIAGGVPLMGVVSDDALLYGQPVPWAHAIGGAAGVIGAIAISWLQRIRSVFTRRVRWSSA